ncbi:methyltransferase domain-containing protein [Dyella telluris]|uniref:Methyltransferase domain-containing protein n=2 Tax=Dyella telluris TaxID=2763498 RepID=A0A7G8QAY1_9GAMM|nr:methyltransferase domain-containing protein [Dyella telluris]
MHTGEAYHEVIQASRRDLLTRSRFQRLALSLLPPGGDVLDFGAGTGIDARTYAAHGHRTFVYEPAASMQEYLFVHCRDELEKNTIVAVDSPQSCKVTAVTANFAVLNHFADHAKLFADLAHIVADGGFVLASLLNPFYLGDARYGWWRGNVFKLLREGRYSIPSESNIHRFAPRILSRAAAPYFRLEQRSPGGFRMATQLYMFLLFRRI